MRSHARLFLVDDHEGNRDTLEALLTDEGFVVDTACGYESAALRIEQSPPYDLVLLDLHLGCHSALPLVAPIRARSPRTKLVILTGSPETVAPCVADAVLCKSDRFELLLNRIIETLGLAEQKCSAG